jgi:hypothetical protein
MSLITHIRASIRRFRRYHAATSNEWILRFESHIDTRAAAATLSR